MAQPVSLSASDYSYQLSFFVHHFKYLFIGPVSHPADSFHPTPYGSCVGDLVMIWFIFTILLNMTLRCPPSLVFHPYPFPSLSMLFYYKYNNIFNCYYNCMLLLFSAPQAMSTRRVEEVRLRWTQADGAAERSTPCGRPHVVDASSHLLKDICKKFGCKVLHNRCEVFVTFFQLFWKGFQQIVKCLYFKS